MNAEPLFRISRGISLDPAVDAWFETRPDELGLLAKDWFNEIRAAGEQVLELVHDGHPVACIEDVPFAYVDTFKAHLNVGFFMGAFLSDPQKILQGSGKRMRHVKVGPTIPYDAEALRHLIRHAYADASNRVTQGL